MKQNLNSVLFHWKLTFRKTSSRVKMLRNSETNERKKENDEAVFVASLANVNTELVVWCWRNCVDETVVLLFIFENLEKTQMCSDNTALGKRDKNGFVLLTNYPRGFCVEQSHFSPRSLYFLLLLSNQPEYTVWVLFLTLARARPVYKNVCGMYVFKCNVWTEIISERVLKQDGD